MDWFTLQIESTDVFFAVTKLFQSKDTGLRRLVYLMIKELSPSADEVRWICLFEYCENYFLLFLSSC